jgi:hypothetical protein
VCEREKERERKEQKIKKYGKVDKKREDKEML